ncbi:MAG TPA: permease prefix domain 1-containing protein [Acidobacteriaceae bacterium]|nr:permease prefix domain 1-containing protein [Acidobacteriaceae bacterium]
MARPFHELRERLLRAGVAPRHVRRYLAELSDHLADLTSEEERSGRSPAEAASAALARLGGMDVLARAMIEKREFQSWSVRAPWATFAVLPLLTLAGAYFVACAILWSGWKIFLPGTETPFVRIDGFAILYFGIGKWLYFSAPILIGWFIGLTAARQRFETAWAAAGMVLMAWMGGSARVHAGRAALSGGARHISMSFALGPSAQDVASGLIHALAILSFTAAPYLIWRLRRARSGAV